MRWLALLFSFALSACAQLTSWKSWQFQLPDGAHVSFMSGETMLSLSAGTGQYVLPDVTGNAKLFGNTIEHLIEEDGQKVLGYRLRIEAAANTEYRLTVEPLAGSPFFPRAPKPLGIRDAQRAEIDLARSRDGRLKVVASIQITKYERRLSSTPSWRSEPQDLTLEGLQLMISDAQVFKNDVQIGERAGGVTGSDIVAYIPGVGRVVFRLLPKEGFALSKTAVVEGNRIIFDIDADRYEIASKSSVIGQPGPWKIYMLRAPNTIPCNQSVDPSQPAVWARTLTTGWLNCEGQ